MTGAQIPKEAAELVHVQILNRADKTFAQTIAIKAGAAVEKHVRNTVVPRLKVTAREKTIQISSRPLPSGLRCQTESNREIQARVCRDNDQGPASKPRNQH